MKKVDVSTTVASVKLKNPTMLASGILGLRGEILKSVAKHGAGAVITKSIGMAERKGYNTPNIIEPMPGVVLNAMGLPNPGCEFFKSEIKIAKEADVPVIASIFGEKNEEFVKTAQVMEDAGADMLEINVSCPHAGSRRLIGQDSQRTFEVVKAVRSSVDIPIMVKLTPNVTDITEVAEAAIEAGANAISAINTIKALYIDIERCVPILSNKVGGMSGFAIKPIAVRCVAEIALKISALGVKVDVVGVGGINNGKDAVEFIMAGASAVQVGTAVLYQGIDVFGNIVKEIEQFMEEKGYGSIQKIKGISLDQVRKCTSMNP
jgi:dihydroorotate dehydrogenase (NAD+) catalytic subunit